MGTDPPPAGIQETGSSESQDIAFDTFSMFQTHLVDDITKQHQCSHFDKHSRGFDGNSFMQTSVEGSSASAGDTSLDSCSEADSGLSNSVESLKKLLDQCVENARDLENELHVLRFDMREATTEIADLKDIIETMKGEGLDFDPTDYDDPCPSPNNRFNFAGA